MIDIRGRDRESMIFDESEMFPVRYSYMYV